MYMIGVARVRGPHMGDHHIVPSVTGHSLSQSKAVWEEEAETQCNCDLTLRLPPCFGHHRSARAS